MGGGSIGAGLLFTVLVAAIGATPDVPAPDAQIALPKVERMPRLPEPYVLRDWKKVAQDLDTLLFDFDRQGEHLPLIWWDTTRVNVDEVIFGVPSYVGSFFATGGGAHEGITCMGAVLGATLVGIDKSNQNGHDWVRQCQGYFNAASGQNVYLNNLYTSTGQTFWYELLPNILFLQILSCYPGTGNMDAQAVVVADRWYDACLGMGGSIEPWSLPDFNHTAFNFVTLKPFDGAWKEADAAAAIAWVEYMVYVKTGDPKYLDAARWGVEYLDRSVENPFYESLLPYGIYAATRMNAELGEDHDIEKMLNWVLDGDNQRRWGVAEGRWGDVDVGGLASSVIPGHGYAFAMNTFQIAHNIAPVVRYDNRFARTVGKWLLNLANAARFFYPNAWPAHQQTNYAWSSTYDPTSCIAYEGLRENGHVYDLVEADVEEGPGETVSGTYTVTRSAVDAKGQALRETAEGDHDALRHVWRISLSVGSAHTLVVGGRCEFSGDADERFEFSWASSIDGPYQALCSLPNPGFGHCWAAMNDAAGTVYLKVEDTNREPNRISLDTLYIDHIYVDTTLDIRPYATGDPVDNGWGATNLGLYGSVFVGLLGALVEPTNIDRILRIDLGATESFAPATYPTYLYYNPYDEVREVLLDAGAEPRDLYDAVSNDWLARNAAGPTLVSVPADGAVVAVVCPPSAQPTYRSRSTLIDGVVIDYSNGLYAISGRVTLDGIPLAGVALEGLSGEPATDAEGHYESAVVPGWSGTVRPTKAGYAFTPASRIYDAVAGPWIDQTFEARAVWRRTDVNRDGFVNALDLQLVVNAVLGSALDPTPCDVNEDGDRNALDVQLVVNDVLGVGFQEKEVTRGNA